VQTSIAGKLVRRRRLRSGVYGIRRWPGQRMALSLYIYITGQYGGAAFILLYIGCVLAVGVPLMIAEFLIGRKTQLNPVGAWCRSITRPRAAAWQ
jgi:hypothetical protein